MKNLILVIILMCVLVNQVQCDVIDCFYYFNPYKFPGTSILPCQPIPGGQELVLNYNVKITSTPKEWIAETKVQICKYGGACHNYTMVNINLFNDR
jgi:hypothetical protein